MNPARVLRGLRRTAERVLHPFRRNAALRQLGRRPSPQVVLVVCHGNICRSPYAAALLRRLVQASSGGPRIASAGFVGPGRPCPSWALEVAAERGLDLSQHRSRVLSPQEVRSADLIVVMDEQQRRLLRVLFGGDAVVLGDVDPQAIERREIEDPVEQSKAVFERTYRRIDRCVQALAEAAAIVGTRAAPPVDVALIRHDEVPLEAQVEPPVHARVHHHFTVDVEEYFQVSAFEQFVARSDWGRFESRVTASVHRILALLERHQARATFFVLGWVAERYAPLVKAIAAAGHEVASHGWDHRRVTEQSPGEFRDSVRRTKAVLEGTVGAPVRGFRAPSFSLVPGREWALDVLIEEGYVYDSSLFPVRRRGYGYPGGARGPHLLHTAAGTLVELPPTTWRCWGVNVPAGGGAYFRLLPYALTTAALSECERGNVPGTFYVHPWEVDADQPRLPVSWHARLRHYGGLRRTLPRLERLLAEFRFTSVDGAGTLTRLLPQTLEPHAVGCP